MVKKVYTRYRMRIPSLNHFVEFEFNHKKDKKRPKRKIYGHQHSCQFSCNFNFHAISTRTFLIGHLTHALPLIKTSLLEDSSKQRFSSLMSLQIWKSGQCFEVSSINYSTNILTFSDWVCLWSDIVWLLLLLLLLLLLYFKLTK